VIPQIAHFMRSFDLVDSGLSLNGGIEGQAGPPKLLTVPTHNDLVNMNMLVIITVKSSVFLHNLSHRNGKLYNGMYTSSSEMI